MPADRRPPPVVPTLTEVIAGGGAPAVATVSDTPTDAGLSVTITEEWVDTVVDRALARLLPELEWRIADALQAWLNAQVSTGALAVADALRDEIADRVRHAINDALGSTRN